MHRGDGFATSDFACPQIFSRALHKKPHHEGRFRHCAKCNPQPLIALSYCKIAASAAWISTNSSAVTNVFPDYLSQTAWITPVSSSSRAGLPIIQFLTGSIIDRNVPQICSSARGVPFLRVIAWVKYKPVHMRHRILNGSFEALLSTRPETNSAK